MSFEDRLRHCADAVERILDITLQGIGTTRIIPGNISDPMRYAVLGGGKRLRAFLVLESAALHDVSENRAIFAAGAIEALHAYSLVHDDLPCMDDDDLRRGQPTVHKKWDEAIETQWKVVNMIPDDLMGWLLLGELHVKGGKPDQAATYYR